MSRVKIFIYLSSGVLGLLVIVSLLRSSDEDSSSTKIVYQGDNAISIVTEVKETPVEQKVVLGDIPTVDRVQEFFNIHSPQLPIVETITYKSRTDWKKGKSAWLSDYASHFKTSRHFIARSLNGKIDYLKQNVKDGDRFNILKSDFPFEFYLVLDVSRLKLWLFYVDLENNTNEMLKSYSVSIGREDSTRPSGLLTPLGKYTLGDKIMIYDPKMMGHFLGEKTEMIRVFGTRWIPFEKEIGECSAPAKGYGIHGVPWIENPLTGELKEDLTSIGKYDSDGCVRLATSDIEELYAIIVSRPTTIEIVKDFYESTIPGGNN
ncbi:L,D-transpeptidase [Chlamydiales bacterium]|nr:L,D-transpeptidase [Chlamydiales bacterium]